MRVAPPEITCQKGFALVVVDMQNKFSRETAGLRDGVEGISPVINAAIGAFRSAGAPVAYVLYDGGGGCISDGSGDADALVPSIVPPEEGDIVVHKTAMNAFNGSGLEGLLRERGCGGIVVCGLVAHLCVLATYFGAFDIGMDAYLLEGGIAATDPANVSMAERMFRTVSPDDLMEVARIGR